MEEPTSNEPAALELGCVINSVKHIIVCGHSDCKAINLLYKLQDEKFDSKVWFSILYVLFKLETSGGKITSNDWKRLLNYLLFIEQCNNAKGKTELIINGLK